MNISSSSSSFDTSPLTLERTSSKENSDNENNVNSNIQVVESTAAPLRQKRNLSIVTTSPPKTLKASSTTSPSTGRVLNMTDYGDQEPQDFFSPETLSPLGIEPLPKDLPLLNVFSQCGFNKNHEAIPKVGIHAIAYEVTSTDGTSLIYKHEKTPQLLTNPHSRIPNLLTGLSQKFQRHGALATACLDLPHLAKTFFYLLEVTLPDKRSNRFFLPAEKIEIFANHLPPDTQVKLEGQVMEKAPGENLADLMKADKNFFHPSKPHFQNIVLAVNEFLMSAHNHNFVHRDLKPENIMYDQASGRVTIIDAGESSRLGSHRRGAAAVEIPELSPTTSTKQLGTRQFMAPSMFEGKEYGSEVDFFSAGMLFLKLISPDDFETFNKNRLAGTVRDPLFAEDPKKYLDVYLKKITSRSQTQQLLTQYPELQKTINRYFQVSAGGTLERGDR